MKKLIAGLSVVLAMAVVGVASAETGDPRVENVQARQIPDTKNVEVTYDLVAPEGGLFTVSAVFQAPGVTPEVKTLTGDIGPDVAPGLNRRFVWNAGVDWPNNVNRNFTCTVNAEEQVDGGLGGVQLWEGGPYWAECNVGASKPEAYGLYFMSGDTVGHTGDWFFDESHCPTCGKGMSELRSLGYIDSTGNLTAAHDAATAYLGSPWRMPTQEEFDALFRNCKTEWTSCNGVTGYLVKGQGAYATRSIFLPAAGYGYVSCLIDLGSFGYYWSASSSPDISGRAWHQIFFSGSIYSGYRGRYYGMPVRPVRGFAK